MTTLLEILKQATDKMGADGFCFANGEPIGVLEKLRDSDGFTIQDFLHARPAWIIQPNNWYPLPDEWAYLHGYFAPSLSIHPLKNNKQVRVRSLNGCWEFVIKDYCGPDVATIYNTAPDAFRAAIKFLEGKDTDA